MVKINIFDRVLKILARDYAHLFLRLAFPGEPIHLVGTLENVELALPEERVDFVHQVEYNGEEILFHLEFQLRHGVDVPRRLFTYSGMLTALFKLPVVPLALYLERREAPIPNEYVVRVGERVVNRFTYPVLKLWDYEDEIRSGRYRELAPLLVMLVEEPTEEILARERELILEEKDEHKRTDLLATAVTIASRHFDRDFLWKYFREEVEQMRNVTFIEDWIEEGVQQGVQQGIQQGLQQGLQQGRREAIKGDILQILQARFGLSYQMGKQLEARFESIEDLTMLQKLVVEAARADSLDGFRAQLDELAPEKSGQET